MWQHHLRLNFIVFVWSFTAILGQWITLPRFELVFLRTFAAGILLYAFWIYRCRRRSEGLAWPRHAFKLFLNGAIVGLHWVLFFAAAQLNASVCLAGIATTTLWTALLEPIIRRTPWRRSELLLGLVITVALYQISRAETDHLLALAFGLVSAMAAAVFSIFNGLWARNEDPIGVTILEMAGAAAICLLVMLGQGLFAQQWPRFTLTPRDWLWMTLLVVFCTAYAYVAYVALLEHLSVFTINLAANFEPVYGMILAALFLGEAQELSFGFLPRRLHHSSLRSRTHLADGAGTAASETSRYPKPRTVRRNLGSLGSASSLLRIDAMKLSTVRVLG